MRTTCPTSEELSEYLRSENAEDPDIDEHLESCEVCQNVLAEMSDWGELDQFRRPGAEDTALYAWDPEDTAVVSQLKNIPRDARGTGPNGDPDLPPRLGPYEVLEKIGSGGLGTAWLAYSRDTGRECVIKILSGNPPEDHPALRLCRREMKTISQLGLVCLETASSVNNDHGLTYLVMSYVKGVDLDDWVRSHGPLSCRDACRAVGGAAIALQQAHMAKVLHLNAKPSNLFRTHDGAVRVLDCGLAPLIQHELSQADFTKSAFVKSTVDFMSPELARSILDTDHRSDIYSLGCSLAFLLSGRRLFAGDSLMQTIVAHRESAVPDVSQLTRAAPPALNAVFAKMLARQPDERYQSMAEVAAGLEPFFGDGPADGDIIAKPEPPPASAGGVRGWLSSIRKRRS